MLTLRCLGPGPFAAGLAVVTLAGLAIPLAYAGEPVVLTESIVISSGGTKPSAFYILARAPVGVALPPPTSSLPPRMPVAVEKALAAMMRAQELEKELAAVARMLPPEERKRRATVIYGLRSRAAEALRRLLDDHPSAAWRADALFARALASLRVEELAFAHRLGSWEAWDPIDGSMAEPEDPGPSFAATIAALQELVDAHPGYWRGDAVLYLLGWCLQEEGSWSDGAARYRSALERWPDSALAGELWLRLAELAFDDGDLAEARRAYEEAIPRLEGWLAHVARYKLGWSYYREASFPEAIGSFLMIAATDAARAESLREEAIQCIAISLTEPWSAREADRSPDIRRVLARLSKHVLDAHPAAFQIYLATAQLLADMTEYEVALAVLESARKRLVHTAEHRAALEAIRASIMAGPREPLRLR